MWRNKSFYFSKHSLLSDVAVTDLKGCVGKHVPALTKIAPFSNKNEKYPALKLLFQDTWLFKTCFSGRVWQWDGMIERRGKNTRKTGEEKDAEIRTWWGGGGSGEGHTILSLAIIIRILWKYDWFLLLQYVGRTWYPAIKDNNLFKRVLLSWPMILTDNDLS